MVTAQVLNDLLNPAKTNLKLREDPRRGFYVEGITEETLLSCEHALSVIAAGDAHRKVGTAAPRQSHAWWEALWWKAVWDRAWLGEVAGWLAGWGCWAGGRAASVDEEGCGEWMPWVMGG